jgi:hypothetical protein
MSYYGGMSMPFGGYGMGMPYGYQGGVPNQLAMLQALQGGYGGNVPIGQGIGQMMQAPQFGQAPMQGMPQTAPPPPQYTPQQLLAQQMGRGSRAFYTPFNSPYRQLGGQGGQGGGFSQMTGGFMGDYGRGSQLPGMQTQGPQTMQVAPPPPSSIPYMPPQATPMQNMGFPQRQPGQGIGTRPGANGPAGWMQQPVVDRIPAPQPQTSSWSSQGPQARPQPFNVLAGEGYQQAPAQQRFSPLRNEGYRNGMF